MNKFLLLACFTFFTIQMTSAQIAVLIDCPPDVNLMCGESTDPANTGMASATDVGQGTPLVPTFTDNVIADACLETIERTWSATDFNGRSSSCLQIITVGGISLPTPPATVNIQCAADIPAPTDLTATDCGATIVASPVANIMGGNCPNQFFMVRTWTFTDTCGNSSSVSQSINVIDNTPPTPPVIPSVVNVQCASDAPPPAALTATDNCDGIVIATPTDSITPSACPNRFSIFRRWTFVDTCGNTSNVFQSIIVNDNTPPSFSGDPADLTINCDDMVPDPAMVSASDNCDGMLTPTFSEQTIPGNCRGNYDIIRTWSVSDTCGNSAMVSQTITVKDTIPPTFTPDVMDLTLYCPDDITAALAEQPVFTDDCSGIMDLSAASGVAIDIDNLPFKSYTFRNWGAIDSCGNASGTSQTIVLVDTVTNFIVCPPDTMVDCGTPTDPMLTGEPTVTESCLITGIETRFSDTSVPGCSSTDTIMRNWVAYIPRDGGDLLLDSCIQTIITIDTIPPIFNVNILPQDLTVNCEAPEAEVLTAIDLCGDAFGNGTPQPAFAPADPWINEIHYDNAGGDVGEFFEIAGQAGIDLSIGTVVLYNGANGTVYNTIALAGIIPDQSNGYGTVSFPLPANGLQNGGPDGIALVDDMMNVIEFISYEGAMTAADGPAAGMTSTDIGVAETSSTPIGESLQLTGGPGTMSSDYAWTGPLAESPGAVNAGQSFMPPVPMSGTVVTFDEMIIPGECPVIDTILRTWTATDECGNSAMHTQTILVVDEEDPIILDMIASIDDISCGTELPTPQMVTATDNCGEASVNFEAILDGDICAGFLATYQYTAMDACGNTTVVDVTFNIGPDTIAPVFEQSPLPESMEQTCADPIPDADTLTAIDICSGAAFSTVLFTELHYDNAGTDEGEFFEISGPAGTDLTGYSVHLYNGNGGATYDMTDLTGVIDDEGNGYGALAFPFSPIQNGSPDGLALVMGNMVVSFISYEGSFTAANGPAMGMTSSDIGVSEFSSNPVGNSLQLTGAGISLADLTWGIPTPETPGDLNPGLGLSGQLAIEVIFTEEIIPGVILGQDTIRRTYSATDACANANVLVQDIIVNPILPEIICPADIIVNLKAGECNEYIYYDIDASTECLDLTVSIAQIDDSGLTSGDLYPIGTHTQTYEVTDGNGNTSTCEFIVQIVEFEPITDALICNDNINISLDETCLMVLPADLILEGDQYVCYDKYLIDITDASGNSYGNTINGNLIGQVLTAMVTDPSTGNTCWGTVTVEDKIPPVIECPCDGYAPIDETAFELLGVDNGHTYYVSTGNFSWLDAQASAAATGAHMLSVNSASENQFIVDAFGGNDFRVWIGLTDSEAFGGVEAGADPLNGWVWTDGSPFSYTNWSGGEPNDFGTGEDYVEMFGSGQWNDNTSTGLSQRFILEVDGVCEYQCTDDLSSLPPPNAYDACGSVELTFTETQSGDDCSGFIIERTWTATDNSGNTATCSQTFIINPLDLETLTFPEAYIGDCGGSTSPTVTGYPSVGGEEIGEQTCNLFTAYWDKPIADCGGGSKIVRTWSVVDWCSQEVREGTQVIKLSDNEGPEMTCPADIEVGTDFWYCHANVSIPKPTVFDACGSDYTLALESSAGNISGIGNNYVINELPLGTHTVTWIATDACDNTSSCSFTITVVDDVPPVPNCDEHTIVSLTNDAEYGTTLVSAEVFDDGSYDNCSEVTFEARRMTSCINHDWTTNGAGIDDTPNGIVDINDKGLRHKPAVPFACCDVAQGPIMVELKVTDAAGNENFCMVEIEVQDKLAPFIECPPNIVVSCDFWFDSEVVTGQRIPLSDDPMTSVFGTVIDAYDVHDNQGARQAIVINDPGRPTNPGDPNYLPQPYPWGIDGWADDNCDVNLDVRITMQDDCSGDDLPSNAPDYAIRYIERRFTATDGQGNSDNCRQVIWVVDFDPFYISDETCVDVDRNDGVKWPCDELYDTCPDSIPVNEPIIYDDNCSLIGVTYEDTRFDFVDGACYKILREWKVIDWCQYNTNTGAGLWSYTQVIKVIDSDGPEFTDCPEGPVTLCAADEGVSLPDNNQVFLGEADPDHTYCSVHVEGSHTVEEFCSDYVIYDVKVYPFNGPDYIQLVNKTQVNTDENGQAVLPFNTRTAPIQGVRLDGLPYNSPYCGDYHKVLWSVEDGCGNISTCEYLLRLEDCKQPSPVCINGLSTVVMPVGGTVTIWAKEYDASSIDDCTPSESLLFSFSGDTYQPSIEYNCDNVPVFGAELAVEVWVADEGVDHNCNGQIEWSERNKDFCTTTIVITDNDGVCGTGNIIGGEIMTHVDLAPVELTTVNLTHPTNIFPSIVTVEDGKYTFTNVPAAGPYTITPQRNDNHKNGVSTLDLVRIQKHLLGVEPFTSAYQYIAADANNNEGVSALDLVEIRKLILGIYAEFPANTSWRFVDGRHEFIDLSNPWPFSESITMESLATGIDYLNENFMAVKVGDLNNTVVANANQVVVRNGNEEVKVNADAIEHVRSGESFEVEMTIPAGMFGFQWTLDLDGLNYIGIESDQLTTDHVGVHNGQITMSYAAVGLNPSNTTFKLFFEATKDGRPADMIKVTSDITEAEGYLKVGDASAVAEDIEIVNLGIEFINGTTGNEYALYQNEPNPFSERTVIGFDLPEASEAMITLMDVTGKVIKVVEGSFARGNNTVELSSNDLPPTGVVYYRLDAGEFTATKKMILIK